jgi:putative transposase
MSMAEDEEQKRREHAQQVGFFRYLLIREAADASLSPRQRGAKVRELAGREHTLPSGQVVRYTRWTLDRWIREWRRGGYDALVPSVRQSQPRTPEEVLVLARSLKQENPGRSAAQVRRILAAQHGWAPDERTLQRMFNREGLTALAKPPAGMPGVFGRWEAARPNELWTGDALHGEKVAGRKTYLFAFIDDHSRAVVGHRWGYAEDTVRLGAALRPALASRGVPEAIYVDNGSAFVDSWLLRACARLGIKLIHSTPGRPQGRGKIERFFRTVTDEFVVEIIGRARGGRPIADLNELNRLFTAWLETVYHHRKHSETEAEPLARWEKGAPFRIPTTQDLAEAFKWAETRLVDKTGLVRMHSNRYQVDPGLAGQRVELVFDPFDLSRIEVRRNGSGEGVATPFQVTRHSHPKARPETPAQDPLPHSGVDYLALLDAQHTRDAAGKVNYAALLNDQTPPSPDRGHPDADTHGDTDTDEQQPGQAS